MPVDVTGHSAAPRLPGPAGGPGGSLLLVRAAFSQLLWSPLVYIYGFRVGQWECVTGALTPPRAPKAPSQGADTPEKVAKQTQCLYSSL